MCKQISTIFISIACILFAAATPVSAFIPGSPVPDTGQTLCYDEYGTVIDCAGTGQDGELSINPMSFTKLKYGGIEWVEGVDAPEDWIMTRDNVTGLIWEIKTDDGSVHDKNKTYTWCDTNSETNGGYAGTCGEGTDTEDFINALNAEGGAGFGGYNDWRMPTREELRSFIDYGQNNPVVDVSYFPKTKSSDYWSSGSYAYGPDNAWCVYFAIGYDNNYGKSSSRYVRAVRSGQSGSFDHLIVNSDTTVTDIRSGLMWETKTDDVSIHDKTNTFTWADLQVGFLSSLNVKDFADWRIPTLKELASITDLSRYNSSINISYFLNSVPDFYWSSSTYATYPDKAWRVNFNYGGDGSYDKSNGLYVRAVRGGQYRLLGHLIISSPGQGSLWEAGETMSIFWNDQEIAGDAEISISRDGGKNDSFSTIATTTNDGSYDWTASGPSSVNCVLKIVPLNDASKYTTQGLFTIYADTTPITSISGTPPTLTQQTNTILTVIGNSEVVNYKYRLNGGEYKPAHISRQIELTGLSDGLQTADVLGQNYSGTWQTTPTTVTWTVDNTPPNAPIYTGDTITSDTAPTWTWNPGGEGNGIYRYKLDDSNIESGAIETTDTSFTSASALTDGSHTLYVQERDEAGNWSASGEFAITVDNGIPCSEAASPPDVHSGNATFTVSYTKDDIFSGETCGTAASGSGLASVKLYVKKPGDTAFSQVAEDTEGAIDGAFQYTVSPALEGKYEFYTLATDKAGNQEAPPVAGYDSTTRYYTANFGITVTPTAFTLSEPSGSKTFTIKLDREPDANITVPLSPSNNEAYLSASSVTLTPANWRNGVPVTVTAADDAQVDGDRVFYIFTIAAQSTDPNFNGIDPADISVTVEDNDIPGVEADTDALTVSEPATSQWINIRLTTQPVTGVTVAIAPSNNECTVTPGTLTFGPTDWMSYKPVQVTAADDALLDGARASEILISTHSADGIYDLPPAPYVDVTVLDDETGVTVDSVYPSQGMLGEDLPVLVTGSGFLAVNSVSMFREDATGEIVGNEIVVTAYNITDDNHMNLTLPDPGLIGNYTLRFIHGIHDHVFDAKSAVSFSGAMYKAVIVAGKDTENSPLWDTTVFNTHYAYKVLLDRGFKRENIVYLSSEGSIDVDGDGQMNDWDGEADLDTLNAALDEIAAGTSVAQFVMYLAGHGGDGTFRISPTEVLNAGALNTKLNAIQGRIETGGDLIFIYDACYSGSFLPHLQYAPHRVVISSAGDHPARYFDGEHLSFSTIFWSRVYNRYAVGQSFFQAYEMMELFQTALLDADGNGVGDYDEYTLVNDLHIGRGGIPASDTPNIDSVTADPPSLTAGVTTATITAGPVTDNDGIDRVWMVISPSCFSITESQNLLEEIPLYIQSPPSAGYYAAPFSDFSINGDYVISVFAKDSKGFFSTQTAKVTLPKTGGTACGTPGDIDQDDDITLKDAILFLKILTGQETYSQTTGDYPNAGVDVDGDLKAGLGEVIYILQEVAELR